MPHNDGIDNTILDASLQLLASSPIQQDRISQINALVGLGLSEADAARIVFQQQQTSMTRAQ